MQQHRPLYVQETSICWGNLQIFLKFSTKVSSSIISTVARAFALPRILNLKVAFRGNGPLVFNSVGQCLS